MRLAIGTVQFGLAYGVAGRTEPVQPSEVRAILEDAVASGVEELDTAAAYGDIESRLSGLCADLPLRIVSKVVPLPGDASPDAAARLALESARRSRERLGERLSTLMLHRAEDGMGPRGLAVWAALAPWARSEGVTLGVSGYGPEDLVGLQTQAPVQAVQLPGNALDQRIDASDARQACQHLQVYLRSAFLQGLLLMPPRSAVDRVPAAARAIQAWHAWCEAEGLDPLRAALGVAKSFAAVSTVVVGVESLAQWQAIARAWASVQPISAPCLACRDTAVIDPRVWPPAPAASSR